MEGNRIYVPSWPPLFPKPVQWLSLRLSCLRVVVYSAEEASTERNSFTPGPLGAVPGLFMIVDTPGAASEQALPWHGHLTGGKAARLGHLQLGWAPGLLAWALLALLPGSVFTLSARKHCSHPRGGELGLGPDTSAGAQNTDPGFPMFSAPLWKWSREIFISHRIE